MEMKKLVICLSEEKAEGIAQGKALNQQCNLRGPRNSKEVSMAGEEKAGWKVGFRNVAASQIV